MKRIQKSLAILLTLSVFLSLFAGISVFTPAVYADSASWDVAAQEYSGDGTEGSPIIIDSLAKLKQLSDDYVSNDASGVYIRLDANITITGGTRDYVFETFNGIFDGNGYKISGLAISRSDAEAGFIRRTDGCTVKNLTLEGNVSSSHDSGKVGGFIGNVRAGSTGKVSLINCVNNVAVTGVTEVGGFIGRIDSTSSSDIEIIGCKNAGNITSTGRGTPTGRGAGGFIGLSDGKGSITIDKSVNNGNIDAGSSAAGFIGRLYNIQGVLVSIVNISITNSVNNGNVTAASSSVGGFIGFAPRSGGTGDDNLLTTICRCQNNGDISSSDKSDSRVGGIIGTVSGSPLYISGCINTGTVSGYHRVGGIVGYMNSSNEGNKYIKYSVNYGEILVKSGAENPANVDDKKPRFGYIIGSVENSDKINIDGYHAYYRESDLNKPDGYSVIVAYNGTGNVDSEFTNGRMVNTLNTNTDGVVFVQGDYGPVFAPIVSGSWYTPSEAYSGEGTEGSPFIIDTLPKLKYLSERVASGYETSAYIRLDADITITDGDTVNQLCMLETFNGTFDGNGHTISGLSISRSDAEAGFIRRTDGCTVKNLTLEGSVSSSHTDGKVGGFIGNVRTNDAGNVSIENCVSNIDVSGTKEIAGFIGYVADDGSITVNRSVNNGNVTLSGGSGAGFIGNAYYSNRSITITYSVNNGNVTAKGRPIGGFIGFAPKSGGSPSDSIKTTVSHCQNNGNILSNKDSDSRAGGIIGCVTPSPFEISYCINAGNISGTDKVGGIVGQCNGSTTGNKSINHCVNSGNITVTSGSPAKHNYGLIIGTMENSDAITFSKSSLYGRRSDLKNPYGLDDVDAGNDTKVEGTFENWVVNNLNNSGTNFMLTQQKDIIFSVFDSCSLELSDEISADFFMDLFAFTDAQKDGAYISLAFDEYDGSIDISDSVISGDYSKFAFSVDQDLLPQTITPTFHYGDGKSVVGKAFSVQDYLNYIEASSEDYDDYESFSPYVDDLGLRITMLGSGDLNDDDVIDICDLVQAEMYSDGGDETYDDTYLSVMGQIILEVYSYSGGPIAETVSLPQVEFSLL